MKPTVLRAQEQNSPAVETAPLRATIHRWASSVLTNSAATPFLREYFSMAPTTPNDTPLRCDAETRVTALLCLHRSAVEGDDEAPDFAGFCVDALASLLVHLLPLSRTPAMDDEPLTDDDDPLALARFTRPADSTTPPHVDSVSDGRLNVPEGHPVREPPQELTIKHRANGARPVLAAQPTPPLSSRTTVVMRARSAVLLRRLAAAETMLAQATAMTLQPHSPPQPRGTPAAGSGSSERVHELLSQSGRPDASIEALVDMLPLSVAVFAAAQAQGIDAAGVVQMMSTNDTPSVRSNPDALLSATRHTMNATFVDDCDDGTTELNQYVLLDPLGKGSQGEVFLAMDTEKNELRAVKAVPRPGGASPDSSRAAVGRPLNAARRRQREQLEREVAIMKRCRHRNVVALYEVIDDPAQERMYLVMQYVEHGPIASVGADGGVSRTVEPVQLARFARQLAAGLEYLHRRGIIHRDIKPENILLGADEQVYLADFGTAEVFEGGARAGVEGTRGTLAFVAPELLEEPRDCPLPGSPGIGVRSPDAVKPRRLRSCGVNEVDGEAVDVWALGVTLYALLYGKLPFFADDARELFAKILMEPLRFGAQPKAACDSSERLSFRPTDESQSSEGEGGGLSTLVQLVDTHEGHPGGPAASVSGPESTLFGPSFIGDDDDTDDDEIAFASSCGGSHGANLATQWSSLLAGMLKKDPRRRWTLKRVRRALRDMEGGDVDAGISTAAESVAISALRPRGSIFGVRRPSV